MAERGIVVSLTSYPPRIGGVHRVIESLFKQTVQADKIILYLSLEEFPNAEENIPDTLRKLIGKKGFRIEWVKENLKSHKKYYYALQQYRQDIVITVDDDTAYAESMISDLISGYHRFPHAVSARRVRIILRQENGLEAYRKWDGNLDEYADIPRMDICAIGVGGICYPPQTGNRNWFHVGEMISVAGEQDDLWLKYNEIQDHLPVVYVLPSQKDKSMDSSRENSLFRSNRCGGNDKCAAILLEMMRTKEHSQYENWFQNLMSWKEYTEQKQIYYRSIVQKDFNETKNVPIYLFGAGTMAKCILDQLCKLQLSDAITAVVVSDKAGNPIRLKGIEVIQLDSIDKEKRFGIIFGVNESNKKQIEAALNQYDYCSIELNTQALTKYINITRLWQDDP